MLDLALFNRKGPVPVKIIAEHQEISESYLEQLMVTLTKQGLTKSTRGVQGGYMLAKEPELIKVNDIIKALDGPYVPVGCTKTNDVHNCNHYEQCICRTVWEKVRDAVNNTLDSITLADLCQTAEQSKKETITYEI